ncbi:MAG: putative ral secretion pathway protein GspC [Pseudomonadota bacterium]|jgi:general secretion pathway protein C
MLLRSLMFLVWALVAASAVFWGMRLVAQPLPVPPGATVATTGLAGAADLTPLLGTKPLAAAPQTAPAAPPPESSRFQLLGVVASRDTARSQGVALIAIDGKTPRAYRVGAVVDGELVLQSVRQRAVSIGPRAGAASVSLELPPLPPPATGVPGAGVPAQPAAAGLPPAQPLLQPAMPSPPPLAAQPALVPGGLPNAFPVQQGRFRSQRFGGGEANPAQPGQDTPPLAEPAAPTDHRNQR